MARQAMKPNKSRAEKPQAKRPSGRPMNLYLHPDDLRRIRELAAYIAKRGFRVSDSQVVKAALRVARENDAFVNAFEDALTSDARFRC